MRRFPSLFALFGLVSCVAPSGGSETSEATACPALGGTFSGVAFTDEQAAATVDMIDKATSYELDAIPGIGPTTANAIVAARPYASGGAPLAKLDALKGIGPTTLAAFRDNASALWCGLDDGRQACCGGAASAPGVVINEFAAGSSGWVELYNTWDTTADLGGYQIDDVANAGSAPLTIPVGTMLPAKSFLVVKYGGINTASKDDVRLVAAPNGGAGAGDQTSNFYLGTSIAGQCFARVSDGGPWATGPVACTKGASNGGGASGGCTATGGTYAGVTFTRDQECRAIDFMNHARYSEMPSFETCQRNVLYDCAPGQSCPGNPVYRKAAWTSVGAFAAEPSSCGIGGSTLSSLLNDSSVWTDDGLHHDTVAHTLKLADKTFVTLDSVFVTKKIALNGSMSCVEIRDTASASQYLTVCELGIDEFADPPSGCGSTCLDGDVGQTRWYRGQLHLNQTFPSGKRHMVKLLSSGTIDQPANPSPL